MMAGQAMVALPTMWVLVAIVLIFVGLRLYTRIHLLDSLGSDDHVYWASSVRTSIFQGHSLTMIIHH